MALISVSPPDAHGYCSFGVEVGVTKPAAESARVVIAEINPHMPRVWGNSFIHLSQIDALRAGGLPAARTARRARPVPLYQQIGGHIADLIDDGATLQMGIGAIPDAVLEFLGDKRDLGIHSEMFSDGIIDLVEHGRDHRRGARRFLPGKIVAGVPAGHASALYRFVHDNPMIEMRPTDFTNDPFIISRNDNMVAINAALQIDLTGQVCADSHRHASSTAAWAGRPTSSAARPASEGGKPIIALPSTALQRHASRASCATLDPGAGVTTTRNDVHYVVTEYGVAHLYGRSVRQRAEP